MREYDENTLKIAERIFEKGDEILEQRRKRALLIKRLSLSVSGLCAAAIVGVALWHNNDVKNAIRHDDISVITETSQTTAAESPADTSAPTTTVTETNKTEVRTSSTVSSHPENTVTSAVSASSVHSSVTEPRSSSVTSSESDVNPTSAVTSADNITSAAVSSTNKTTASARTTSSSAATNSVPKPSTTALTTSPIAETYNPSEIIKPVIITVPIEAEVAVPVTTMRVNYFKNGKLIKHLSCLPVDDDTFIFVAEENVQDTEILPEKLPDEVINADYILNGRLVSRMNYSDDVDDHAVLVDDNMIRHDVSIRSADDLSADEIISIMGDTGFCDENVFSYSGVYDGDISSDILYFALEHYSYVPETETVYSTRMKVYCVRLDDGSRAYAVKLPQSGEYYLYKLSEKAEDDFYWRER